MKIKLQTGKEVFVEAFHCTPTYAGLLVGSPTKESNDLLIKNIRYPSDWGNRVCILKKSDFYVSENLLKPIIYSVWLSSSEPIEIDDIKSDGSQLVLMWFGNDVLDKPIQEIITDGIRDIDWNRFAENFYF